MDTEHVLTKLRGRPEPKLRKYSTRLPQSLIDKIHRTSKRKRIKQESILAAVLNLGFEALEAG